jgi:hypothetical protein
MHAWTKFESVLEKHLHEPCEMMELAEHKHWEKMEIDCKMARSGGRD